MALTALLIVFGIFGTIFIVVVTYLTCTQGTPKREKHRKKHKGIDWTKDRRRFPRGVTSQPEPSTSADPEAQQQQQQQQQEQEEKEDTIREEAEEPPAQEPEFPAGAAAAIAGTALAGTAVLGSPRKSKKKKGKVKLRPLPQPPSRKILPLDNPADEILASQGFGNARAVMSEYEENPASRGMEEPGKREGWPRKQPFYLVPDDHQPPPQPEVIERGSDPDSAREATGERLSERGRDQRAVESLLYLNPLQTGESPPPSAVYNPPRPSRR